MEIFRRNYLSTALLLFALAALSFACEAQSKEQSSKLEAINELVSTYAEYGQFNGAILVAHEGELVYKQGFGLANMEWEIPNQTDTKFRLGSISKQFTAMLIMQLVAEGKLELNAPLARYLPDYPKENAERITIHQLLTHSAGVPNNYDSPKPKVDKPDLIIPDNYRPQDLVAVFSGLPLDFTPGVRFSYSNSGYVVLGYLIEQITEKSFAQVLEEKILQPLGMKNTGIEKHRPLSANRAAGYFQAWGTYYNANYVDMSSVFSAGAIYSTVEDLWLWDQALYEEKLLPKAYLAQIFSQQISDPDYGGHYGYGWSLTDKPLGSSNEKIPTVWHDGVIDGFCAVFTRIPSSQSSVILLSNIRRAPLNAMTRGIMGILYDQAYDFPLQSVAYSLFEVIDTEGLDKGIKHFESIKADPSYYLVEDEMNIISYRLLQSDRGEEAVAVLRLAIEAFPNAFNLYDSLGEVLKSLGQKEEAIKNYQKSIELNPNNENGKKMLEELLNG